MEVKHLCEPLSAPGLVTTILNEWSAVTDYRTLRDSLPRRLATLLQCRCVLFYQRIDETLQFASGSFDDRPGWSAALLAVAHINPVTLHSDVPEAVAWRERRAVAVPAVQPTYIAAPLIYRQRAIGVLVTIRGGEEGKPGFPSYWADEDVPCVEALAAVVALLLENTRLLERDRERIHELALLNSISSQMNCSLYERARLYTIVVQRTREIAHPDLCEFLDPSFSKESSTQISPALAELLLCYFQEQPVQTPLVLERSATLPDALSGIWQHLPSTMKTFFAVPLLSGRAVSRGGTVGLLPERVQKPKVLGVIVGAFRRAWKLRREEVVLLQVLASQASAVLENMSLVAEVVEARNEARKLLRQVVDDQRFKELVLENMPSGLITLDQQGRITTFNHAAEAILGYHPYEILGQPLSAVLDLHVTLTSEPLDTLERTQSVVDTQGNDIFFAMIRTGEVRRETVRMTDRTQQEIVLDVEMLPLSNERSERIGTLITFSDMTSVHRLEEEKRRLDRLAALGEMAANVAHEVRNPLASIKTSIQMLVDDLLDGQEEGAGKWEHESTEVILKEVERLDSIVRDLLLFAKPRHIHYAPCDIVALSTQVLRMLQAQCTEANIEVHTVYGNVPPLRVDMGQIEQVLFNLCMNALQAMSDGGVLTISCQVIEVPPEERRGQRPGAATHHWCELSVSDTGTGIPPEQLGRIFQPFFTTKAHGMGLGLPITRRLIEDHGGYIHVESQFGFGATFSVRLPVLRREKHAQEEESDFV